MRVSVGEACGGRVENQRTPSLALHPAQAVRVLAKSFVHPWTCHPPTTASAELPPRPLAPQPLPWPSAPWAGLEPAAVPPCTETGIAASPCPRRPIRSPASP